LHILKNKSVKTDNPHIQSKRRNNRKNRRFSSAFQRHHAKDESAQLKTPEESICSTDGNAFHPVAINIDDKEAGTNNANNLINTLPDISDEKAKQSDIIKLNTSFNDSQMLNNSAGSNNSATKVQFKN
jgi:hypothetical protein